jgi:carbon-monoxide dehydrogenase medium subunit
VALAAHCRVEHGLVAEARLVLAGVGVTPVRAARCEAAVVGRRPDAAVLAEAGRALDADLDPPDDVHGSAAFRRHLARVLLGRALAALVEGA